jgi:hypothetical protein
MGNTFGTMIGKLSVLIGELQKSGIQVNTSVTEIAATARELGKTVDELNKMVEQTSGFADTGQSSLGRMEEAMRHIKEASFGGSNGGGCRRRVRSKSARRWHNWARRCSKASKPASIEPPASSN